MTALSKSDGAYRTRRYPRSSAPPTKIRRSHATPARGRSRRPRVSLWEVSGRHNVLFDDRTRLDDRCIRNWLLRSDLEIVAKTIPTLLRREGA
jgi:lipopolysaccharide/colanic/teichoic acid biosynthesis glycosyltransferase